MSFFDMRFKKNENHWEGMQPPRLSILIIIADLRWHNALYQANKLPIRTILFFNVCRIIQLVAYYYGWKKGLEDDKR